MFALQDERSRINHTSHLLLSKIQPYTCNAVLHTFMEPLSRRKEEKLPHFYTHWEEWETHKKERSYIDFSLSLFSYTGIFFSAPSFRWVVPSSISGGNGLENLAQSSIQDRFPTDLSSNSLFFFNDFSILLSFSICRHYLYRDSAWRFVCCIQNINTTINLCIKVL